MSLKDTCQFCVQTSSQIDSLEYQLEQAQRRIAELESALKVCRPVLESHKYDAEHTDNYYGLVEAKGALEIVDRLINPLTKG